MWKRLVFCVGCVGKESGHFGLCLSCCRCTGKEFGMFEGFGSAVFGAGSVDVRGDGELV